ncbi:rho guanine nucleotide exchange factor 28 isoform X2 [Brachyhypopomus gauderio]|uniref:rho guanine nucleotide exchange factor 28 isoform X2 n=1 Tax=Brachyhypopomus gauderio TaxID=698409 RepID=UPI004042F8BA
MPNHTRKANDLDKKSHTAEGTVDSSGMDMGDWSGSETVTLLSGVTDAPPPIQEEEELKKKQPWSHPFSPSFSQFSPTSPAGLVLDRFLCTARLAEQAYHSTGLPPEPYELSPSLVALEMNSEEEDDDFLMKKPLPQISLDHKSNGEDEDRIKGASDFTCIGSHSNAFPFNHTSLKDSGDQGVRLRSYSYSAPKISLLPPCFCRDAQPPPNHFSNEQQTFSLTEQPQEKRMEEEEWDRYIIPSNTESEKHRVSRTFSFIKSCMYSTRNKSKGKSKDKEAKEKQANDEQPATGGAPGPAACEVRDHLAAGEESLHSSNCTVTFHKGCKDSALQCLKKVQEKYAVSTVKTRAATLPQNFIVRESSSSSVMPVSASLPVMTVKDSKDSVPMLSPLSRSVPLVPDRFTESTERKSHSSAWRTNVQTDEILQTMESTSTDSSLMEDAVDVSLHIMVGADTLGLEVESWSLAVESWFCQGQEKYTIKRQDIIYELMQTELHHLQTLTIMAEVFRRGMRDEVGLDAHTIGRIFPCLDELLLLHKDFLSALRDRRQSSTQPDSDRNYLIHRVGDVLMHQFTQENAKNMKQVYGEFCSHHNEAVSFFKELQQQNKKFQLFIKQQSSNSLVKRREIPECILLVTQRITKYPVLLERILQYTEEGTVEHRELRAALAGVRELLSAVNVQVSEREQSQRLRDVLARMEAKSMMRLEGGLTFRKQDLASGRTLLHHGPLLWKTATGRLKDVLALLLTDLLIFLQEKDQKFIFAAVDQKPPVISLQKLIVREVANEERGMFLICTSSARPEMYEVHAISKDERNAWMSLIREAVMICHEKEDETASESEEEKRAAEAKVQNIHKLQETLCGQDQLICSSLEEKLQIYAELSAMSGGGTTGSEPRLLVRPGAGEPPHATALLTAALREAETLRAALLARCTSSTSPSSMPVLREPSTLDTSTSVKTLPPAPPPPPLSPEREPQLVDTPRDEEEEMVEEENTDLQAQNHSFTPNDHNLHLKVCQSVQSLTQLLYSLQAAITIQDSCYEVERLLLLLLSSPAHPHPCAGPDHAKSASGRWFWGASGRWFWGASGRGFWGASGRWFWGGWGGDGTRSWRALRGRPWWRAPRGRPWWRAPWGRPWWRALWGRPWWRALRGRPWWRALRGRPWWRALRGPWSVTVSTASVSGRRGVFSRVPVRTPCTCASNTATWRRSSCSASTRSCVSSCTTTSRAWSACTKASAVWSNSAASSTPSDVCCRPVRPPHLSHWMASRARASTTVTSVAKMSRVPTL